MPDLQTIESWLRNEAGRHAPGQPNVDFAAAVEARLQAHSRRRRRLGMTVAAAAVIVIAAGISAGVALTRGSSRPAAPPSVANAVVTDIDSPLQVIAGSEVPVSITVRTHAGIPLVTRLDWGDGEIDQRPADLGCPTEKPGMTSTRTFVHRWSRPGDYVVTATGSGACGTWHGRQHISLSRPVTVVSATVNAIVTKIRVPYVTAGHRAAVRVTITTHAGTPTWTRVDFGDGREEGSEWSCARPVETGGTATVDVSATWREPGTYQLSVTPTGQCGKWTGPQGQPATASVVVH